MDGESVLDLVNKTGVGGGVEDVYGEDRASEDQLVTPWTVTVARDDFQFYRNFFAAAETLAAQVTEENYAKALIYPPFTNIRKISAHIAAEVAAKAYELGLTSRLPRPKDLVKYAESCMYTPVYRSYR